MAELDNSDSRPTQPWGDAPAKSAGRPGLILDGLMGCSRRRSFLFCLLLGGSVFGSQDSLQPPAQIVSLKAARPPYATAQVPPGAILSQKEAEAFAGKGDIEDPLYLRGVFRVTAAGVSRAVLRDFAWKGEASTRVVVDYPYGVELPKEGKRIVRDATHPLLIRRVVRGTDGVVTIYAFEIAPLFLRNNR